MRSLWRGIVRTVFWSYERGSWPYDLMVILIVFFVLLTPRAWFRDQPLPAAPPRASIKLVADDALNQTQTYRIDSAVFATEKRAARPTPELERETHDLLGRNRRPHVGGSENLRKGHAAHARPCPSLHHHIVGQAPTHPARNATNSRTFGSGNRDLILVAQIRPRSNGY